ncbi:MAG: DUF167 family protein [Planctomycetota bacterium]|jgi:uncharacterized protein (TIGR00251 family)
MKDIARLNIRGVPGGAVLPVKVVPGASRDKIAGVLGDSLKVTTSAPPEKGKANLAVAALLARALGVDTRSVELVSGPANPRKEFRIAGLSPDQVRQRLSP